MVRQKALELHHQAKGEFLHNYYMFELVHDGNGVVTIFKAFAESCVVSLITLHYTAQFFITRSVMSLELHIIVMV